jgi:DNA-binding response OmpR family regulator
MKSRILLVEDDPNLGLVLKDYLELKGDYHIVLCEDGQDASETFHKERFDLCILDVMMPKKDGFTLAREIREQNQLIPILFTTAKTLLQDKVEGFSIGADDYLTKPFRMEELLLRIKALLKRVQPQQQNTVYQIGKLCFDTHLQKLKSEDTSYDISGKEAQLLSLLCEKQHQVLSRDEALLKIWNDTSYFNGRSMDVYISKLRKLLSADPNVKIMNIHGKGFKLTIEE